MFGTTTTPYDVRAETDKTSQGLFNPVGPITLAADAAIPIDRDAVYLLTKGSAAAMTIAAPGAVNLNRRITIEAGSDYAHVVTFSGGTLWDGTAGVNSTWTSAAYRGSSLTIVALTASLWVVESFNLGTIAP